MESRAVTITLAVISYTIGGGLLLVAAWAAATALGVLGPGGDPGTWWALVALGLVGGLGAIGGQTFALRAGR